MLIIDFIAQQLIIVFNELNFNLKKNLQVRKKLFSTTYDEINASLCVLFKL